MNMTKPAPAEIPAKVTRRGSAPLSVQEANEIQAQWMTLDPDASEAEKNRVFRLMDRYPRNYLSISGDRRAVAIYDGMPRNQPMPIAEVIRFYGRDMSRDLAWHGDHWVAAPVGCGGAS